LLPETLTVTCDGGVVGLVLVAGVPLEQPTMRMQLASDVRASWLQFSATNGDLNAGTGTSTVATLWVRGKKLLVTRYVWHPILTQLSNLVVRICVFFDIRSSKATQV
jgi:hypothetical protein